jgi:hypothetical protein
VGKIFFKYCYAVHVFGIVEEAAKKCWLYMFGEDERIGEGAAVGTNSVVSMLYHWIKKNRDRWPLKLHVHCDNCSGQNKNNMMLWFFLWCMEQHDGETMVHSVILSFMLPGHTKFAPDAYFGLFKSKYYVQDKCDDMNDLVTVANSCTAEGNVKAVRYTALEGDGDCVWRNWKSLASHYQVLKGIKSYHHIKLLNDGCIKVQALIGSAERDVPDMRRTRVQETLSIDEIPVLLCEPMANWRRTQLHDEIRPFLIDPHKRETMWPLLPEGAHPPVPLEAHNFDADVPVPTVPDPEGPFEGTTIAMVVENMYVHIPRAVTRPPLLTLDRLCADSDEESELGPLPPYSVHGIEPEVVEDDVSPQRVDTTDEAPQKRSRGGRTVRAPINSDYVYF